MSVEQRKGLEIEPGHIKIEKKCQTARELNKISNTTKELNLEMNDLHCTMGRSTVSAELQPQPGVESCRPNM